MTSLEDTWAAIKDQVSPLAAQQGESLLGRFGSLVQDGTPAAAEVLQIFREAAVLEAHAAFTEDPVKKAQLKGGVETALRRAKTIARASGVVASDLAEAWFEGAAKASLAAVGGFAQALVSTVIESAAKGAVEGATGGGGSAAGGFGSLLTKIIGKG